MQKKKKTLKQELNAVVRCSTKKTPSNRMNQGQLSFFEIGWILCIWHHNSVDAICVC